MNLLLLLALHAHADPLRFVVVGDTQTDGDHTSINWDVLPGLIDDMNAHNPDVGLFVGDLVGGTGSVAGTVAQWEDFQAATAGFGGTLLAVPGNHDVYGGAGTFDAWRELFSWLPTDHSPPGEGGVTYVWDVDTVRFVSITSDQEVDNPYDVSPDGLVWLNEVLTHNDAEHTFVMTHHPVSFSTEGGLGHTGGDFWQTLVAHDVVAMFAGHWHRYQPAQLGNGGLTWETIIGTGGGWTGFEPIRPEQQRHGFLLVTVDGPNVTAEFYSDEDGDGHYDDLLDAFEMRSEVGPTSGLRLHYAFDELDEERGFIDDAPLGTGLHGTPSGHTMLVDDGALGSAVSLDGSDDFVVGRAIDAYRLSLKGALTVSAWVRTDTLSTASWGNTIACYATNDHYTEDEETNYAWWLSLESDGRPLAFWEHHNGENTTLQATEAPPAVADGTWHHVAFVRDPDSAVVRFFWDGAPLGEPVAFDHLPTGASRGLVYVGADTEGLGDSEFHGDIDELCVFDEVLTDAHLAELAAGASCVATEPDPEPDPDDHPPADDTTPDPTHTHKASTCGSCASAPAVGWLWLLALPLIQRRRS